MRLARRLTLWLLCCFGLVCWVGGASEAASTPAQLAFRSAPFVTVGSPEEGEQLQAEREVKLADPAAVAERKESRTRFAGLRREEAVALAKQTFSIEEPSWAPPGSGGEGTVTKYLGEHSAVEVAPSGKHLVVTSTVPLRSIVGSGRLAPTSLALSEREGAFVPANPLVPISISKSPGGGVLLPLGVSVAPVDAAAPEAPVMVGEEVFFPGTATDTDFMVEPAPQGVEASWLLRSQSSPEDNALRFALPLGAKLRMSKTDLGGAEVVHEGQALAVIRPAHGIEADGSELPVSYSVSGDTLTTHVDLEGSVAFPVMVDPLIQGFFGGFENHETDEWADWTSYTPSSWFSFYKESQRLLIAAEPGAPANIEGQWDIGRQGAGITRVDIRGLGHYTGTGETNLIAGFGGDSWPHPGWTYNGYNGIEYPGEMLLGGGGFAGRAAAFCADGEGGKEGEHPGLCNENDSAEYFFLEDSTVTQTGYYTDAEITGAAVTFLDTTPPSEVALQPDRGRPLPTGWLKYGPSVLQIDAADDGVGVEAVSLEIPAGHKNSKGEPFFAEETCSTTLKEGLCPERVHSQNIDLEGLETGVHELGVYAYDAAGNMREEEVSSSGYEEQGSGKYPTLYVDHTPPVLETFSGSLAEASGGEIGSGDYGLKFGAEDGSSSAPQSGVHRLTVSVDGRKVDEVVSSCPEPTGVPSSGCFDLGGSWTMEGAKYGAGTHTITVTAEDWAGNESSRSIGVTVNEAPSEAVGPGSVNVRTGAFKLETTDVSIASPGGQLTVGRSFNSRQPTQGASGPLGPQWTLSLPDAPAAGVWHSLKVLPDGDVQGILAGGGTTTFLPSGSGYTSPVGYQNLTLTELSKSPLEYELANSAGDATIFKGVGSTEEAEPELIPSTVEQAAGAGGFSKMTYIYSKTSEGVTEPKEALAPYPASIPCLTELVQGCRALEFVYATSTGATGEAKKEWGTYKGRLSEVRFVAWSPSEQKMAKQVVAKYLYDSLGRLRDEFMGAGLLPSPETLYGYSAGADGLVTSVSPPGEEPWLLHYGTTVSDPDTGRLLWVSRFSGIEELWNGKSLTSKNAPTLTKETVKVGETLGITSGSESWSPSTVSRGFQWERCLGTTCEPILGATNATYTPVAADKAHDLRVQVTAIDAGGSATTDSSDASVTAGSEITEEPVQGAPEFEAQSVTTIEYEVPLSGTGLPTMTEGELAKWGEKERPIYAAAVFSPDEPQSRPAGDYKQATIYYLDSTEHTVNVATPAGGISTAEYDLYGDTTRTLSADNRATALKEDSKSAEAANPLYNESRYSSEGRELLETLGPEHKVKIFSNTAEVEARKQVTYSYNEEGAPAGGPYRLPTETVEDALVGGTPEDSRVVTNSYSGQNGLGWELHEPTSTTIAARSLALLHSTVYSPTTGAQTETTEPGATANEGGQLTPYRRFGSTGSESEKLADPSSAALEANGNLLVTDAGAGRIEEYSPTGEFRSDYGSAGSGRDQSKEPRGIAINTTTKNVYIADEGNNRIDELNEKGEFVRAFGFGVSTGEAKAQTCTTTCQAGIAGSAAGQLAKPRGIAIDSSGHLWIADYTNNRIDEFSETGEFIAAYGFGVAGGEGKLESCTTTCSAGKEGTGSGQFHGPAYLALSGEYLYVTDSGNNRVEMFSTTGGLTFKERLGSFGHGEGQLSTPEGIAVAGQNIWVDDSLNDRVEELNSKDVNDYINALGSEGSGVGELTSPEGLALTTTGAIYVVDSGNNRVQEWLPGQGNAGAYTSQIIYYTPKTEASVAACQDHPEWAGLPCQKQPAHQPETPGAPPEPVTTMTYDIWDEAEVTKSTSGEGSETQTRTETDSYSGTGRLVSKQTTSTAGTALPKVIYSYNTTTGLLASEATGSGSSEQKITEEHNLLGQLISYTDAAGKTTTFEYEKNKAFRLIKTTSEKGSQTPTYNETTGLVSSLYDSSAGTFTATYDVEENVVSETMPNGLKAATTRNQIGEPTGLEYCKEAHCTEANRLYFDDVVPSIHGQWMTQTSTVGTDSYGYNGAGWLTSVQETPAGKGCVTRLYSYNADGDRVRMTKRPPATGGACAPAGGEIEGHSFDTADRLIDVGVTYNPFGDITALPAVDAGGSELTSSFYADGQVASQEQNGQSIGYELDPARRTNEAITTGSIKSDVTANYEGSGSAPGWLSYTTGEWTRNIFGISGGLVATQTDTETPVLQIADLHGDIVATVADTESAKMSPAIEQTEYGVPTVPTPPKYSWLGASALRTELPSGVVNMGARSYVPQIGQFLQPDPVPGGSNSAYGYTRGDPLNESDPSGEWSLNETSGGDSAIGEGPGTHLEGGVGVGAGAIEPAPADVAAEEAFWADPPWDQVTAGSEEFEEFGSEEEEFEMADYQNPNEGQGEGENHTEGQGESESHTAHPESGVLSQALLATHESAQAHDTSAVHVCRAGRKGPCDAYICAFDRVLTPPLSVEKNDLWWELCNSHGKKIGYIEWVAKSALKKVRRAKHSGGSVCEAIGLGGAAMGVYYGGTALATSPLGPEVSGPLYLMSGASDLVGIGFDEAHNATGC